MIFKRKKNTKQRGSKTHGWGAMKKHRGAGNRGGKGKAGSGKRADQKKPVIWKGRYFGKRGFKKHNTKVIRTVSLLYLEENVDKLVSKGLASKQGEFYVIDVKKLGFEKVLGKKKLTKKFKIKADKFSESCIKTIESSGGKILE